LQLALVAHVEDPLPLAIGGVATEGCVRGARDVGAVLIAIEARGPSAVREDMSLNNRKRRGGFAVVRESEALS
jgi:hypothetical protein